MFQELEIDSKGLAAIASCLLDIGPKLDRKMNIEANSKSSFTLVSRMPILSQGRSQINLNSCFCRLHHTLDQSRGRKTDGGTRRSQRRGEEEATLVTVDQPFRHRTNQNQHPESGCWISLVHI